MIPEDVVVIGASVAGVRFAQTLRRRKYTGRLRLLDTELGLPYDKPALSKEVLTAASGTTPPLLVDDQQLSELGIELLQGCPAQALDATAGSLRTPAGELSFDAAIIATGATPRRLPVFDGLEGVHHVRFKRDAEGLRRDLDDTRHLVVIGGGFIGGEVASSARRRGIAVTLIEAAPRLLGRTMPEPVAAEVADLHRTNGVAVHLDTTVVAASGHGRIETITLSDGRETEVDTVVVGIGARPATDWLEGSAVPLDDGVLCEPDLGVEGAPGIYAIGDVARWRDPRTTRYRRLEHWTAAREQAALVAGNIAKDTATPFHTTEYVWSDQHGVRIQHVGQVGDECVRMSNNEGRLLFTHRVAGDVVGATGFDAASEVLDIRRRLGAVSNPPRPGTTGERPPHA